MLRGLRILGIITFSGAAAYAAFAVQQLSAAGVLLNGYGRDGRGELALLVFALVSILTLIGLEIRCSGRDARKKRRHKKRAVEAHSHNPQMSNIYAAPRQEEEWNGRKRSSHHSRQRNSFSAREKRIEPEAVWMIVLKLVCGILPMVYAGALVWMYLNAGRAADHSVITLSFLLWVTICSAVAAVGVLGHRIWGLYAGYILALSNLVIFPYGSGVGLVLLLLLIGSGPVFTDKKRYPAPGRKVRKVAI